MTSKVTYTGELRTTCRHVRSGNEFITDAPTDNNGLGEAFSPTDTVAIKARDINVDLSGATANVTKHMASELRRISKIEVDFELPALVSEKNRTILERTANTCPVHYSLHPDIEKIVTFNWVQE